MTETNGDKLLRGVVTKWTVWDRILKLSHGPKWPVVLQYPVCPKSLETPQ
jgi:hypothetical protein